MLFSLIKRPKQKERAFACFFVFAASLIYLLNHYSVARPAEKLSGETEIVGTIISGPETEGEEYKYTLKIRTVNVKNFNGSVEVSAANGLEGTGGDIMKLRGKVRKIENEGFFNSKAYYYGKGVFIKLQTNELGSVVGRAHLRGFFYNLSAKISSGIKGMIGGEEGALLAGIVANDKNSLSTEATDAIRAAGYSHLINVSGLHLSIVSSFFFLILTEILRMKRKFGATIT